MANSLDPDDTPRSAASHLGLHCLLRPAWPSTVNTVLIVIIRLAYLQMKEIVRRYILVCKDLNSNFFCYFISDRRCTLVTQTASTTVTAATASLITVTTVTAAAIQVLDTRIIDTIMEATGSTRISGISTIMESMHLFSHRHQLTSSLCASRKHACIILTPLNPSFIL